ncbi:MAG: ATP-binding protein [Clostridia bacterium]|nr:ATP-binding protein [Clostridia bacterium]
MKYSEIIYSKAEAELKARRVRAEELAEMRRKQFAEKYPELIDIENIMKFSALEVIRSVGSGGKSVNISEVAKTNLEAQARKKELLVKNGYPADYLDVPYTCKKCNDSGIFNGKLCECHLALLQKLSVEGLSCSPILAKSTFDTFNLEYYSAIKDADLGFSHREIMGGVFGMLKNYAENFGPDSSSLFFSGGTGLGKTHLALAIFNVVTANGYSVYYSSARKVIKQLNNEHFGKGDTDLNEELSRNDLVIIDDLGAEFETPFGTAAINEIIDDAVLMGKPMILISNLDKTAFEERYGERVASRLNAFEIIQFFGTDIRQRNK